MNNLAELLEEELEAEAQDPCNGKTCSANEHCCDGHVCVDTDDSKFSIYFILVKWTKEN